MINQLRQVFRTYYTQWFFWFVVIFWLVQHGFLYLMFGQNSLFSLVSGPRTSPPVTLASSLTMILMTFPPNLLLGMMIGIQVKLQFANPRARLLPGFAAAHLLVAGGIITVVVASSACVIAWLSGAPILGMIGCILIMIAITSWACYFKMEYLGFIALIPLVFTFAPKYIGEIVLGGGPIISLGEVCIGLGALAALGVRLVMLSEEMPEYSSKMPSMTWDFKSRSGNRDLRQWEAQRIARSWILGWLRDVEFRLVFRRATAQGPLRRLLLRQLASGFSGLFLMLFQFGFVLFIFLIHHWLKAPPGPTSSQEPFWSWFLPQSFFLIVIPTIMLGSFWMGRWPLLVRESLLPLSRTDFIRDIARNNACDMACVATGHFVGLIVGLTLFQPQVLLIEFVLPSFVLTLAQYILLFYAMLWLVTFRSNAALLVVVALGFMTTGLIFAVVSSRDWSWFVLEVAVTLAAIAGFRWLAFRRWRNIELD